MAIGAERNRDDGRSARRAGRPQPAALSYREIYRDVVLGAKVVRPKTIRPCPRRQSSTFTPEPSSWPMGSPPTEAVTAIRNQTMITVQAVGVPGGLATVAPNGCFRDADHPGLLGAKHLFLRPRAQREIRQGWFEEINQEDIDAIVFLQAASSWTWERDTQSPLPEGYSPRSAIPR